MYITTPPSRRQPALVIASLFYLVVSLGIGLWYLSLLSPSLANDLWWAGFSPTGGEALLIDLVNAQLALTATSALSIYAADTTMNKLYNTSTATTIVSPTYSRHIIFTELTSIEYAVPQLRTLSAAWSMRMNVQHCWVDFNKTFEVAHTVTRQQRCKDQFATNGAVYLEAIWRNVVWADYMATWGGVNSRFVIAYERALQETDAGKNFLSFVSQARNTTSISDELTYWRSYKLDRFELQWQSRWQPGITESIVLENAIGLREIVSIKNFAQGTGPYTSIVLFWIPLNDLRFAAFNNRSLIRGSSRFFDANISSTLPVIDPEVFGGVTLVSGRFFNQSVLFRATIGPFQSVDCLYRSPPVALLDAYKTTRARVHAQLTALSYSATLALTPLTWRNHAYFGGNPICTGLPSSTFVQQSFDFYDDCSKPKPLVVTLSSIALTLVRAATSSRSIADICTVASPTQACVAAITAADKFLASLASPLVWNTSVVDAIGPDIGLMQYATAANGSWVLLQQPLLEPSFAFFGYAFLFDWVLGNREVVSFQGDNGNLTLISNVYSPQLYATGTQPLQSATQILFYLVVVTSIILVSVGGIVLIYAVKTRFRFNGVNLFFFNRIVGAVWIGRPLAFLRGISAVLLLSSARASLATSASGASRFIATPWSWLEAIVVTGEATWLTYVANDILVLLTRDGTKMHGSTASLHSWLLLFIVEVASPVTVSGNLHRVCVGVDMDYAVSCSSGALVVGSSSRLVTVISIQAGVLVLVWTILRLSSRWRYLGTKESEASLLVNGIAEEFVTTAPGTNATQYVIDDVACVLAGLLALRLRGVEYIFDIKLWLLLKDARSTTDYLKVLPRAALVDSTIKINPLPRLSQTITSNISQQRRRLVMGLASKLVGLVYIVSSISSSVSYLNVSQVNLANDVYWATFNTTGAHAFIANWLNEQLVIGNTTMIDLSLDRPSINAMTSFAASTAVVASPQNYGAYLQHTLLSSIEATIEGLRRSNGCDAPWIFSPYCYLDLKKTWTMANSAKRQARCDSSMTTNGAVYLETVLRNIDFGAFHSCWGTGFDTGIGAELKLSSEGRAWLEMVSEATPQLSLSEEALYWRSFGLTSFEAQWQNYKQLGVRNSYSIINAFGIAYPLTLASLASTYRLESQTTFKMYWSLANDLSAVAMNASGIGGRSLLRSSATYAFTNTSLASVYVINGTLPSPLSQGLQLIASYLGPFGSIDMVYVPPPLDLQQLMSSLLELTRAPLSGNLSAQSAYRAITPLDLSRPAPKAWLATGVFTYGGSPLCTEFNSGQRTNLGLTSLLSFDAICLVATGVSAKLQPTRQQYVLGSLFSNLTSTTSNFTAVCALDPSFATQCRVYLPTTRTYIRDYMEVPPPLASAIAAMTMRVRAMNISLMIYARTTLTAPLELRTTNLLAETDSDFSFFGWLFLYDWVFGYREVVSFQGDTQSLVLVTDLQTPLSQPTQSWEVPDNIARYLHSGVLYVTGVMIAIACLVICYMLVSRGQFEGWNMLELGRVGGIVWVGRPFLLLRSVTALVVLSTATLQLQNSGSMSYFATVRDPWYKTLLAANEVTWLITIVNDIFLIVTGAYTTYYITPNGFVVWVFSGVLTLTAPVAPLSSIHLNCQVDQIDADAVCTAGTIQIGSPERMLLLAIAVLISQIVSFAIARRCLREVPSSALTSLFLSSGAKYLFLPHAWMHDNIYYVDRASAVLDGLLTLRYSETRLIVLDIKTWRVFAIPLDLMPKTTNPDFMAAVPLLNDS